MAVVGHLQGAGTHLLGKLGKHVRQGRWNALTRLAASGRPWRRANRVVTLDAYRETPDAAIVLPPFDAGA